MTAPDRIARTLIKTPCQTGASTYDNAVSAVRFGYIVSPLLDLQEQRDKLALAMRVRLGKHGFQLIARRLPVFNSRAAISVGAPRAMMQASFASEGVRRNVLARIAAGGPGLGLKTFKKSNHFFLR